MRELAIEETVIVMFRSTFVEDFFSRRIHKSSCRELSKSFRKALLHCTMYIFRCLYFQFVT